MKLSASMIAALVHIGRQGRQGSYAGLVDGKDVSLYDGHCIDGQRRTLLALERRGLVTFEARARLTVEGQRAVQEDIRMRPGQRDFKVIDPSDDDGPEAA